jgi:hypothetical protein
MPSHLRAGRSKGPVLLKQRDGYWLDPARTAASD